MRHKRIGRAKHAKSRVTYGVFDYADFVHLAGQFFLIGMVLAGIAVGTILSKAC